MFCLWFFRVLRIFLSATAHNIVAMISMRSGQVNVSGIFDGDVSTQKLVPSSVRSETAVNCIKSGMVWLSYITDWIAGKLLMLPVSVPIVA